MADSHDAKDYRKRVTDQERSIIWALLTGHIRVRGGLSRLQAFGRCFPG